MPNELTLIGERIARLHAEVVTELAPLRVYLSPEKSAMVDAILASAKSIADAAKAIALALPPASPKFREALRTLEASAEPIEAQLAKCAVIARDIQSRNPLRPVGDA